MRTCSYTWEEWDWQCPEETWTGSEEYCIFHDPSQEKDIRLFEQKLEEKLEKEDYNFTGYCFPEEMSFKNTEFGEYTYFRRAIFLKDADFIETNFQKGVDFRRATFLRDAYFNRAIFQEDAYFNGATFQNVIFIETNFQKGVEFTGANLQYASFTGANLEKGFFIGATFKNAYFNKATFQEDAYFKRATFQNADFIGATFQEDVSFMRATFQKASFMRATFQNVSFRGVTFKNVYFKGAVIKEDIEFASNRVERLDLRNVKFFFRGNITADLRKAKFHRAHLENVTFIDCTWPKKIYEEIHMKDEDLSFKELETIYRNLKQNMQRHGDYSKAGDFYYSEMECRKKNMREKRFSPDWFKSLGYSLLKYTCGYGEKPLWVIRNSLLIILLGAILFFFCGVARVGAEIPPEKSPYIIEYSLDSLNFSKTTFIDFGYCFYYSVVTFTTLGYGDIHPLGYSHIFAFSEAFIGAFFIALFVVVFARRMMR